MLATYRVVRGWQCPGCATGPRLLPSLALALLLAAPAAATAQQLRAAAPLPTVQQLREELGLPPADENDQARIARFAGRYSIATELAAKIFAIATAEGIDPDLAFRLVYTESRFKTRARGPRGALGLAQLMPSTARALDPSLRNEAAILDPDANLRVGFRYLRRLIHLFNGDVRLGLLAYNRGEGTVSRVLRQGKDPENGYSRRVLGQGDRKYEGLGLIPR